MRPRATPVVAATQAKEQVENPSPAISDTSPGVLGVSELMLTSLPPMMSGADVYARQFYRGNQLPYRRYLPLKGL